MKSKALPAYSSIEKAATFTINKDGKKHAEPYCSASQAVVSKQLRHHQATQWYHSTSEGLRQGDGGAIMKS